MRGPTRVTCLLAALSLLLSVTMAAPTNKPSLRSHRGESKPQSASSGMRRCFGQADGLPTFTEDRFPFCQVLDKRAVLYWTHNQAERTYANLSEPAGVELTLGLVVHVPESAADWVALGLSSDSGGMKSMDVAMLWLNDTSAESGGRSSSSSSPYVLEDRWSTDYAMPRLDVRQDKELVEVVVKPNLSLVAFVFKMKAPTGCGEQDEEDVWISDRTNTFISWAYGRAQQQKQQSAVEKGLQQLWKPMYHGPADRAGGVSAPLLTTKDQWRKFTSADASPPPDAETIVIQLPNVTVPSDVTTSYQCMWLKAPSDRKYHFYSTKRVGNPEVQSKVLHHVMLYIAHRDEPFMPVGEAYDCIDDLPSNYGLPVSALNKDALISPDDQVYAAANAGFPFGNLNASSSGSTHSYWILEVHYENINGFEGLRDDSGVRVVYSPTLRPHDAGAIVLGAHPSHRLLNMTSSLAIPPNAPSYSQWEVCAASCLGKRLATSPPGGSQLIAAGFHMHRAGISGEITIEHASGERTPLVNIERFDFTQTQAFMFQTGPPLLLSPGDRVITRCTYNSTGKDKLTRWGPSVSRDEMCIAVLYLVPIQGQGFVCASLNGVHSPVLDQFSELAGVQRGLPRVDLNLSSCFDPYQLPVMLQHPDKQVQLALEFGFIVSIDQADLLSLQEHKTAGIASARPACNIRG